MYFLYNLFKKNCSYAMINLLNAKFAYMSYIPRFEQLKAGFLKKTVARSKTRSNSIIYFAK